MRHRKVSDLMTTRVARVHPDASFKQIVATLTDNDVTGLPVVDEDDRPVGVVSEADLLRRESAQPDPAGLLDGPPAPRTGGARDGEAAHATTAAALMTSPAVVARQDWTVVQAARTMDAERIKRLPVVDESGRLVGIVSRSDLLRVFLRKDHAIREEISGDVLERTLLLAPGEVVVTVADGCVTLRGTVAHRAMIPLVVRLCQGVDGVVDVTEELDYRADEPGADPADPRHRRQDRRVGLAP
jgi:CBS domain-containing protein